MRSQRGRDFALGLAIALALSTNAVAAQPDGLIGNAGNLWYVANYDLSTGAVLESVLPATGMTGLAMAPNGELFGVIPVVAEGPGAMVTPWLARVDVAGHSLDLRGQLFPAAVSLHEVGLAFDSVGRLWLVDEGGRLYQVDPGTAAVSEAANFGRPVHGLAGCGSTLFGLTRPSGQSQPVQLVRIEPDNGPFEVFGPGHSEVWMGDGGGLDFDTDGRLWGVLHNTSGIPSPVLDFTVEFDPATGGVLRFNHVGELGRGLAIGPPPAVCPGRGVTEVPALGFPGLVVLAGLLAIGAVWRLKTPAG